jgi:hypothetical protein
MSDMFNKPECCEHCGAKVVEYRHTLNRPLADALHRLYMAGDQVNLSELRLTRNQWNNFQKLRYWGLVEKGKRPDGSHIAGEWFVTLRGRDFIEGRCSIHRWAWTYRGKVVKYEGNDVFFNSLSDENYLKRTDYASTAVAHAA